MTQIAELVTIWMFFRMRFRKYSMSVWLSLQLNSDQDVTGKVNQEGVDYYNRLIDYMLQQVN